MELQALAEAHPTSSFVGVDPAREMLKEAERALGPLMDRVTFVEGYIDDAPSGPFDAAACLLALHFLDQTERAATIRAIHQRLKHGVPFVVAQGSFPQAEDERPHWLGRYESYAVTSGGDREQARKARMAVGAHLPTLLPKQDSDILSASGFSDVALFFAAFTGRGWVARA